MTRFNGTRTDYRYYDEPGVDQSQRLRQLTVTKNGTPLLDLAYDYDAVSNLTGLTDATPGRAESLTLAYDAFNRLRTVSGDTDSASYTYDRLDRLASVTEGSSSTSFGAWSAGTETNIPGQPRHAPRYIGNPGNQFGYDPAGNMTLRWLKQGGSYTAYTQKFNVDNRLSQIIGTGTTITYDLDAQTGTTIRRTQTSGSTTTVTDFVLQYSQKNVTTGEVTLGSLGMVSQAPRHDGQASLVREVSAGFNAPISVEGFALLDDRGLPVASATQPITAELSITETATVGARFVPSEGSLPVGQYTAVIWVTEATMGTVVEVTRSA